MRSSVLCALSRHSLGAAACVSSIIAVDFVGPAGWPSTSRFARRRVQSSFRYPELVTERGDFSDNGNESAELDRRTGKPARPARGRRRRRWATAAVRVP